MGSKKDGITGYNYYATMHMGLGHGPVDAICEIRVGDRRVWPLDPSPTLEVIGSVDSGGTFVTPYYFGIDNGLGEGDPDYRIAVALPLIAPNPPYVVGQNVTLEGFSRYIANGEDPAGVVSLDGTYEMAPRTNPEYGDWLWLWISLLDEVNFTHYADTQGTNLGVTPGGSYTAVDYGSGVTPPYEAETIKITTNDFVKIDAYHVFGGEEKEGGVLGWLTPMLGFDNQMPASDLVAMRGENTSAFRGMCTVIFKGIIAAINPYPKQWAFRYRRALQGWDGEVWQPELAKIILTRPITGAEETLSPEIHAMNPAHILYECYTNRKWGRGLPRAALDETTFLAAAETLAAEGFGLCLRWARTDELSTFVQTVLDHIGAAVNPDRVTGKLKLELIRGGYDVSALPLFDVETGLLSISEASVAATANLVNSVQVTYRDPISNKDGSVAVQNIALLQANGGQWNQVSKDYPGLPTADLARRVATRDLKAMGSGLRKFVIVCDRRAWAVQPGHVIRIQDISRGIEPMVVRVGTVRDGTFVDGSIELAVVQDVFSFPATSFVSEQPSLWVPPSSEPCLAQALAFELPYVLAAGRLTDAEMTATDGLARIGVVVASGSAMNQSYQIATRNGASTEEDDPLSDQFYCGFGD